MGNEFGHPEWIDFPREGNGWSHKYCRRQWSLVDNGYLKYGQLNEFDKAMIHAARKYHILDDGTAHLKLIHQGDHILAYERGGLVFVFNFDPQYDHNDYIIPPRSWATSSATPSGSTSPGGQRLEPQVLPQAVEPVDNGYLKYGQLNEFDKAMIHAARKYHILDDGTAHLKLIHQGDHILAYERGGLVFVFNFDPQYDHNDYIIPPRSWATSSATPSGSTSPGGQRLEPQVLPQAVEPCGQRLSQVRPAQ